MPKHIKTLKRRFLAVEFPEALKAEIKKDLPPTFDVRLTMFLNELQIMIKRLTYIVSLHCEAIVSRGKAKGKSITVSSTCCNASRCSTCLGKRPLHYPYFSIKASKEYNLVRTKDRRALLTSLEFDRETIEIFESAIDARHQLIQLYHNTIRILHHIGATELSLE